MRQTWHLHDSHAVFPLQRLVTARRPSRIFDAETCVGRRSSGNIPVLATMKIRYFAFLIALPLAGCFYPPVVKPPPPAHQELKLAIPYDLTWNAVKTVIADNRYQIVAENPNRGIIETQAPGGFTLKEADCGELRGIAGKYAAEPDPDSSAVFNFTVKPLGRYSTMVRVDGVFTAPLHVPLHPTRNVECASRGVQEHRLLEQIAAQARKEHHPRFKRSHS